MAPSRTRRIWRRQRRRSASSRRGRLCNGQGLGLCRIEDGNDESAPVHAAFHHRNAILHHTPYPQLPHLIPYISLIIKPFVDSIPSSCGRCCTNIAA
jgi:hypothetical protein